MGLKMKVKKSLIGETAKTYQKSTKKRKGEILNTFIAQTGYHRKYAITVLKNWGKAVYVKLNGRPIKLIAGESQKKKPRKKNKIYDPAVQKDLKKIWYILDCMCGKRMAPAIQYMLPILEKFDEIRPDDTVRAKLIKISPATIDRLLADEKKKLGARIKSRTKPGTLLKNQIPIRTFSDWYENRPGFIEIDLCAHCGGNASGDFAYTLTATDVCTGWTEMLAVRNKAQKWVFEALDTIIQQFPFTIKGIDSDNGSEFINDQLYRYCQIQNIKFTRGRPYKKNDNCYVEQKNNSVIRRNVGYKRYDTMRQLKSLNEIYKNLRLLVNFFYPSMKIILKTRDGSKVRKKYDVPATPLQRLMEYKKEADEMMSDLLRQFETLNPAELKRNITALQNKSLKIAA